jgi:hypothetical protein
MSRTLTGLLVAAGTVASGMTAEVHGTMIEVLVACAAAAAGMAAYAAYDQKKSPRVRLRHERFHVAHGHSRLGSTRPVPLGDDERPDP